jgi:hypothetical protein
MPRNKDLKRLVRSRMKKTRESYTAARSRLLEKRTRSTPKLPPGLVALAGMRDEAVRDKTGKSWKEWVGVLDEIGAYEMTHRDIARHLQREIGLPGWWAQTVTVGYERIRGLRDVGQQRGGGYAANKSKTFPVPVSSLYRAFSTARTRKRWLPAVELAVRTSIPDKSMRITWPDGTSVEAYFTAKGSEKSQVAIQHRKLAARADAEGAKAYWEERLQALAGLLVSGKVRRR